MVDRDNVLRAIEAQESLRGIVPDDVVDAAITALRASLGDDAAADDPASTARRRQATILFADVAGFTAMSETLDAEEVAGLMNDLWAVVDVTIDGHGGRVDKHIGDAVMGVWGVGGAREDDPERAVRAALALRDDFDRFRTDREIDIGFRIGVNTGPVLFGEVGTTGEQSVTGDAVNVASRVEHAAPPDSVLISHDTYRHVRGIFDVRQLAPIEVKGKSVPLSTYVVERAKPRAFRLGARGVQGIETRMVGRDAELDVLRNAYLDVLQRGRARVVTVVGEAGAGKSRLLDEFASWLDLRPEPIHYLKGRSVPDAQNMPRGLLRELFAYRFEIFDDDDPAAVADKLEAGLLGLGGSEAEQVGRWLGFDIGDRAGLGFEDGDEIGARACVARHLRAVLGGGLVVVLLEDVHWADLDSLDAVEWLVDQLADEPLVVVCLVRPSFHERRPTWGSGPGDSTLLEVDALSPADAESLVREILQRVDAPPAELVHSIVAQADGNPFYVEEVIKMLVDEGAIVAPEDGPWTVSPGRIDGPNVPATLSGVLQSRLDSLPGEARRCLQHAAVVGRIFWDDAVAALLGDGAQRQIARDDVAPTIGDLQRLELVRPNERSTFSDAVEFKFKHALLRDVTYETVLLSDRRRLHSAAARWLERRAGGRLAEHLGPLGEHLVGAGEHERAAAVFEQAAVQAASTGALRVAVPLYRRAIELRDRLHGANDRRTAEARLDMSRLLVRMGDVDEVAVQLDAVERAAQALGDDELLLGVMLARLGRAIDVGRWDEAERLVDRAEALARHAEPRLAAEFALRRSMVVGANVGEQAGLPFLEQALSLARAAGDRETEILALHRLTLVHARGDRFDEAERIVDEALSIARRAGNRGREAQMLHTHGMVTHMQAGVDRAVRLAKAIDLYERGLKILRELGIEGGRVSAVGDLAQAEVEAGRLDSAARHAHEYLVAAVRIESSQETRFAVVVHGQLLIAAGDRSTGLRLIGAVIVDARAAFLEDELERVLHVHGIDADDARPDFAVGAESDVDTIVEQLVEQGVGGRLAHEPFSFEW